MEISFGRALWRNFLGQSPDWYKLTLLVFLVVNPVIFLLDPFVAGWMLVAEFIFTLAMALKYGANGFLNSGKWQTMH